MYLESYNSVENSVTNSVVHNNKTNFTLNIVGLCFVIYPLLILLKTAMIFSQ